MISLSKLATFTSGVLTASVVAFSLSGAFADSPGQLTGGPNVYVVKNLTQNGSYAASISAACGDEVQYSAELHNAANGGLTNVVVSASLANGSVNAVPSEGASEGTTGSVSVSVASGGTLSYENGSTVLKDSNGYIISNLADGIVSGGVNVGNVNGSTTEFVDFKAKVSCPTAPQNFTSTQTVSATATASASATANCPKGDVASATSATASASGTASASASATSTVSQADADSKASALAQSQAQSKAQAAAQATAQASAQAGANAKCTVTPPPTTTPPTTTTTTSVQAATTTALPNTGPGDDVAELFAGTSALGAAGHYLIRRFRR